MMLFEKRPEDAETELEPISPSQTSGSAIAFLVAIAMASVGAKSDLLNVLGDVKARVQEPS